MSSNVLVCVYCKQPLCVRAHIQVHLDAGGCESSFVYYTYVSKMASLPCELGDIQFKNLSIYASYLNTFNEY